MATNPAMDLTSGIHITGTMRPGYADIFSPAALAFVADLHRTFNGRRLDLLKAREERQKRFDADPVFQYARRRGDAAAVHAGELPRSDRGDPRSAAGRGALDGHDRGVSRRDQRGFRREPRVPAAVAALARSRVPVFGSSRHRSRGHLVDLHERQAVEGRHAEIDRILAKVSAEGLQSLTKREKSILRDETDKRRKT